MEDPPYIERCLISHTFNQGHVSWRLNDAGTEYLRIGAAERALEQAALLERREEFIRRAEKIGYASVDSMGICFVLAEDKTLEAVVMKGPATDRPDTIYHLLFDELEWVAFLMGVRNREFDCPEPSSFRTWQWLKQAGRWCLGSLSRSSETARR